MGPELEGDYGPGNGEAGESEDYPEGEEDAWDPVLDAVSTLDDLFDAFYGRHEEIRAAAEVASVQSEDSERHFAVARDVRAVIADVIGQLRDVDSALEAGMVQMYGDDVLENIKQV